MLPLGSDRGESHDHLLSERLSELLRDQPADEIDTPPGVFGTTMRMVFTGYSGVSVRYVRTSRDATRAEHEALEGALVSGATGTSHICVAGSCSAVA